MPYTILTSDTDWNPSILDNTIDDNEEWFDALSDFPNDTSDSLFDLQGNYRHRHVVHYININSIELENCVLPNNLDCIEVYEGDITPFERETILKEPDYASHVPHFALQSVNIIKKTFAATI